MIEIVRGGAERIPDLEPLWHALAEHHAEIAPQLGPTRALAETWRRRREHYERTFAGSPATFVLVAERDGHPVGYALVSPASPSQTWEIDRAANVETLAVLPSERGAGIGSALLDRVREEIRAEGYTHWGLATAATNEAAIRFYRRQGFDVAFLEMLGRP
jgi:ribosomal protein S18 acetylase RimI-like enzyme